jgi:hypothetical protein
LRRLKFALLVRRQRLGQQRVEQATAGVIGGGEACLQPVAQRHQIIDLGDDAVLLGERREGNRDQIHTVFRKAAATSPRLLIKDEGLEVWLENQPMKKPLQPGERYTDNGDVLANVSFAKIAWNQTTATNRTAGNV